MNRPESSNAVPRAPAIAVALLLLAPIGAVAQPAGDGADGANAPQTSAAETTRPPALLGGGLEAGPKGESLNFFNSLLRVAQLGSLLQVPAQHTLIAPSDRAFRALPPDQLSDLIHRPDALRALLAAHIVPGRVAVGDLRSGTMLHTLDGQRVELRVGPDTVMLNQADVLASADTEAGMVHVVDRLL